MAENFTSDDDARRIADLVTSLHVHHQRIAELVKVVDLEAQFSLDALQGGPGDVTSVIKAHRDHAARTAAEWQGIVDDYTELLTYLDI